MSPHDEFDAKALHEELEAMCAHPRFRRNRLHVCKRVGSLIVYGNDVTEVVATFLLPEGGRRGCMLVNDTLIHTMIRAVGGKQSTAFMALYGIGSRPPLR